MYVHAHYSCIYNYEIRTIACQLYSGFGDDQISLSRNKPSCVPSEDIMPPSNDLGIYKEAPMLRGI